LVVFLKKKFFKKSLKFGRFFEKKIFLILKNH